MKESNLNKINKALFSNLSGVSQSLAAGWIGVIIISPGLEISLRGDWFLILTRALFFAILFLFLAILFQLKIYEFR